jgi:hypothetical protein
MAEIDLPMLRRLVAGFPDEPPRTIALEQKIRIGAGFHNKWYSSQREHWLGWLSLKSQENKIDGKTFAPRRIWSGLKCSPMMFWLAEVSGKNAGVLEQLERVSIEASKERSTDGNPHGVNFRKVLPWTELEVQLQQIEVLIEAADAVQIGEQALERLIKHLPSYRKYNPRSVSTGTVNAV